MDQIAADDDVTSFLNDRFHPWFIAPEGKSGMAKEEVLFLNHDGCLLTEPTSPKTAAEWIITANRASVANETGSDMGPLLPTPQWKFPISDNHPLNAICNR